MDVRHESKNLSFREPFGAVKQNEACKITLAVKGISQKNIKMILRREGGETLSLPLLFCGEKEGESFYGAEFKLQYLGLYFYHFEIEAKEGTLSVYKKNDKAAIAKEGEYWQISCYDKDFETPEDFCGAVFYQIFPDRFFREGSCDLSEKLGPFHLHENFDETPEYGVVDGRAWATDFFGGNFRGIVAKLDYLKELNVSAIYLNPIFMAESNHRYDTADYHKIDPMLGTEKDFENFCNEAHKRGIKIVLDGVFSHTGSRSVYFDKKGEFGGGAFSDENSIYKSWYNFHADGGYDSWWGIDTLPAVNENNPYYIDFMATGENSVLRHWLRLGADGFRLDVADELPDEFIEIVRKVIKEEKKDAILIGEVWEDASNKIAYSKRRKYLLGHELDSVMNYPFLEAIIAFTKGWSDAAAFKDAIMKIIENYPKEVLNCLLNSLGTHDTIRILTNLGDGGVSLSKEEKRNAKIAPQKYSEAVKKLKFAAALQFSLPGCPCIYYGDEAGLEGYEDPYNRRTYPWGRENAEILDFYKKISALRKYDSMRKGETEINVAGGELTIKRTRKNEVAEILFRRETLSVTVKINGEEKLSI